MSYIHTYRQKVDRHTDAQLTKSQTDRQSGRQKVDRHTDAQLTKRQTDRQTGMETETETDK
jgi:hypothetical protein